MKSGARLRAAIPAGSHRLAVRLQDVTLLQSTSGVIADLGVQLDTQLATENRPAERMRMLRETTNRITRAANDAVAAYARTSRALKEELARPNADVDAANAIRVRIDAARRDVLRALDEAKQRYPSVEEPMSDEPEPGS